MSAFQNPEVSALLRWRPCGHMTRLEGPSRSAETLHPKPEIPPISDLRVQGALSTVDGEGHGILYPGSASWDMGSSLNEGPLRIESLTCALAIRDRLAQSLFSEYHLCEGFLAEACSEPKER